MAAGARFRDGDGVEKDLTAARHYFTIVSANGHVRAQYELELCLASGLGGAKDPAAAAYWCERAANQDYDWAQTGIGVERNIVDAYKW